MYIPFTSRHPQRPGEDQVHVDSSLFSRILLPIWSFTFYYRQLKLVPCFLETAGLLTPILKALKWLTSALAPSWSSELSPEYTCFLGGGMHSTRPLVLRRHYLCRHSISPWNMKDLDSKVKMLPHGSHSWAQLTFPLTAVGGGGEGTVCYSYLITCYSRSAASSASGW